MTPLQPLLALVGAIIVLRTIMSAVRTFVVPRGDNDWLSRISFRVIRRLFDLAAAPSRPFEARDRVMAYYGPVALILLPGWWLILISVGFGAIFWALGLPPL